MLIILIFVCNIYIINCSEVFQIILNCGIERGIGKGNWKLIAQSAKFDTFLKMFFPLDK